MKTLILTLILSIIGSKSLAQADSYIMIAPNVAFDVKANDPKNLFGITLEVGKYFGDYAVGINSGYYSVDKRDLYSELMVTAPIHGPFTISIAAGWFYYKKDITMEYDINYSFATRNGYTPIISYSLQTAFGTSCKAFSIGINKDF
jgi:hypothetical protein